MSLTRCDYLSKEHTHEIRKNITKRFVNLFEKMCYKEKINPQQVQLGLVLAQVHVALYFEELQDCNSDVMEIMNEIEVAIEKSREKGIHFAVQAFALQILTTAILGINPKNLGDK